MQDIDRTWEKIAEFSKTPAQGTEQYQQWLKHSDTINYLLSTSTGFAPIYVSGNSFFAYSVLVPKVSFKEDYINDLLSWNFVVSGGWGYGHHYEDGIPHKAIFPPMSHTDTSILDNQVPIIYYKEFYGYPDGQATYLELDQRMAHILDLHWVDAQKSYCKLDHLGDVQPVVKTSVTERGILSLANLQELDFYMYLTDTVIVRVFDVMKYKGESWDSKKSIEEIISIEKTNTELHARLVTQNTQSYIRGFQIISQASSDEKMDRKLEGKPDPREYASFIALDWKHQEVRECSCDPEYLGNYFVESDFPFETTPAFFRTEVILKYKQNPGKYTIEARQITCRGAWSLPYDINEENQVHAYLKDLSYLPYEEQLYWKASNEPPKASISSRAYKTDFLAEWDLEYDALSSLRNTLDNFPVAVQYGLEQYIWRKPAKARNPYSRLSYVVTNSPKEWEDQILELSRIVVDNFDKGNLRKVAKLLGCDDAQLGSLSLLRLCLKASGVEDQVVEEVMKPLFELWQLRSKGIAHFGDSVPNTDLGKHYATLLESIDRSMNLLTEFINDNKFSISNDGKLITKSS